MLFKNSHINRSNYEEFFLLYTDNELGMKERVMVEKFVEANPDLKGELDALLETRLPKENIPINKSFLIKEEAPVIGITDQNYQECFLLYIDNELNPGEKKEVERFVLQHPQYASGFSYLQRTVLAPEKIVFDHKDILYKEPEPARVVTFRIWRWAAAAAIIILGGVYIGRVTINRTERPPIVQHNPEDTSSVYPQTKEQKNIAVNDKPGESLHNSEKLKKNNQQNEKRPAEKLLVKKTGTPEKKYTDGDEPAHAAIASDINAASQTHEEKTNNLHEKKAENAIADIDVPRINEPVTAVPLNTETAKKSLTENVPAISNTAVTYSVYSTEPEKNGFLTIGDEELRKSGLKGFFRKAKRILERRTNINTGDENSVLIGGFEIALRNRP